MKPFFSIIIPSFNQGHFIEQTIISILNQSYKSVEIIVIDGGSTDHTIEVLKTFGDKILWVSEKDNGQTHAINKGIKLAKGNVIAYLNSDDYYLEGTLDTVVKYFEDSVNFHWVTGDYIIVNEEGQEIQNLIKRYKTFFRKKLTFNILTILNPIIQPSTFISKSMVDKIGFLNEELQFTMDYEYWLRAIKIQMPIKINKDLSAFRIHSQSKGVSKYEKQFDEELEVAKRFQKSYLLILIHYLHNIIIKYAYRFLK